MADAFWDSEQTVAEIKKNDRGEVILIKLVSKNRRRFVDIRTFYTGKDGNMAPGKGIAVPFDLAEEVAAQVMEAVRSGTEHT